MTEADRGGRKKNKLKKRRRKEEEEEDGSNRNKQQSVKKMYTIFSIVKVLSGMIRWKRDPVADSFA